MFSRQIHTMLSLWRGDELLWLPNFWLYTYLTCNLYQLLTSPPLGLISLQMQNWWQSGKVRVLLSPFFFNSENGGWEELFFEQIQMLCDVHANLLRHPWGPRSSRCRGAPCSPFFHETHHAVQRVFSQRVFSQVTGTTTIFLYCPLKSTQHHQDLLAWDWSPYRPYHEPRRVERNY